MYRLQKEHDPNACPGIIRIVDGAFIPDEAGNIDWDAYQQWRAEGNTPEPAA